MIKILEVIIENTTDMKIIDKKLDELGFDSKINNTFNITFSPIGEQPYSVKAITHIHKNEFTYYEAMMTTRDINDKPIYSLFKIVS